MRSHFPSETRVRVSVVQEAGDREGRIGEALGGRGGGGWGGGGETKTDALILSALHLKLISRAAEKEEGGRGAGEWLKGPEWGGGWHQER